ncbi:D-arabinitol 2-dehydrogenase [ribulose-forming] [[Candida] railenensis]|uniref:D-arabinitol 2-dehydrogenase [ribulose-forming] n=1 Tax=[Candida] railenensis TaxID=45579 RepID=A0A9P0W0R5_9ASCO|nr:D-arabinitol 2-dehydrogenase [ribulose-forming] [[Candida] railenensis]
MVDYNVNGKVALITGGTRGLGLDIAETYVLNGIKTVIITSRKAKACEESKAYLEKVAKDNGKNVEVISIPADISKDSELAKFVSTVLSKIDQLNILVANAGATWGAPLEEHPISAVRKVLDLNITSVFACVQAFTPLLEKSATFEDPSRVLITSSVASMVAQDGAGTFGYIASKAGVTHMGKNLAISLGPRNINVNSLSPGFFPTKMSNGLIDIFGEVLTESNPKRRLGRKADIQAAALFLSAQQSNYINGINLPIDGGANLVGMPSKL